MSVFSNHLYNSVTNVALLDEFDKILSTMRSREISISIIIQNLAQLKALFKDSWESIVGNCDEFLYLGGDEQSTHEYISKLLGKATIDTNTYGKTMGRSGSYSTNYQQTGRELLMPDEVRILDNEYALLFVRGERPLLDSKISLMWHPRIALTTDGGYETYDPGKLSGIPADIHFDETRPDDFDLLLKKSWFLKQIHLKSLKHRRQNYDSYNANSINGSDYF